MKKAQRQSISSGSSNKHQGNSSTEHSANNSAVQSPIVTDELEEQVEKRPIFKSREWHNRSAVKKKALKQILAQEKTLQWPINSGQYSSIEAPPSFKPSKKYTDLLGLKSKYTDPQTKLQFANSLEFMCIRSLPSDIVNAYLTLRNAKPPV